MHDMSRWTFLASLFFSISLCGTAYDAVQGSAMLAGAGNPAAMERTLTDFVGRMGGVHAADLPAAPVASPVALEYHAGAKDEKLELEPLADFLNAQGKVKVLDSGISAALGYSTSANIKQKAWQTEDAMKHYSQYNTDNNTDIIFCRQTQEQVGYVWLTDRSGKLVKTIKTGGGQAIKVPNSEAADLFKGEKEYFLAKVPPAQVASGEPGTN
jgi:hypothetical protein